MVDATKELGTLRQMADSIFHIWETMSSAEQLGRGGLVLALLTAAICDLRARRIPNILTYGLAVAYLPYGLAISWGQTLPLTDLLVHVFAIPLGAAALVFALGFAAFAGGIVGGGDVKLLSALTPFVGLKALLPVVLIMAIAGGVLSALMLMWQRLTARPAALQPGDSAALNSSPNQQIKVPYGVAIAAGGLWYVAFAPATTQSQQALMAVGG